ncbi:odorant receptor 49b [Monomorium pharaonis]|uniref:odorant receptor 49b n=1 Tax=Monomorium pharaonis TaxID=307658 RepID=UPI00102E1522|nr:odorant receptor 49b [Monomorium pharaonis]
MEFLGYQYYKLYRIFLLSLGLWPYDSSFFKRIYMIFCIFTLLFSIITQFLKLFTTECNLVFVLTDLSFVIPCIAYLLKYSTFCIQSQKIKKLMEHIRIDWTVLQDEEEIEIIQKYAKTARRYMYAFVGVAYPGTIVYISIPILPDFLDIVSPLNESRKRYLPFLAEYFLDEQKYFYPILLHMAITIVIGVVTVVTTETLTFAYVCHVCGMFEIVSYRITCALDKSISILLNEENMIRVKLIGAVEIHQKAFKFFEYLISTFSLSYFILIILGVVSLSLNLFRLFQTATLPDQRKDFAPYVIFVLAHFYYMFICNYMGQKVIDSSTDIFRKAYDTQWYMTPIQTQKLLLFVMQRTMKSCKIIMGNLYCASVEQFTTLASMSLSYFTVIYSVQQ